MLSRRSERSHHWPAVIAVAVLALIAVAMITPVARAQTFNTPSGSSVGDGPVDATATFTVATNQITITIRDLEVNPTSVGQTINGVDFSLSNGKTVGSITSQDGTVRTVTGKGAGQYSDTGGPTTSVGASNMWNYVTGSGSGSNLGIMVTSLGNHAAVPTVIGDPNSSNAYSNGNGSITGNHNPFLAGTVTLVLSVSGVTSSSTITGMQFQFGTSNNEGNVTGDLVTIPEPSTFVIAGLGALGFIGFGLRRRLKK